MANQMTPAELIRRLHDVIDTALSDSFTAEIDRAVGQAEIESCEAERREAEDVRDEVIAALRRLAAVIDLCEAELATTDPDGLTPSGQVARGILRAARGDTTNENRRQD